MGMFTLARCQTTKHFLQKLSDWKIMLSQLECDHGDYVDNFPNGDQTGRRPTHPLEAWEINLLWKEGEKRKYGASLVWKKNFGTNFDKSSANFPPRITIR